MRNSNWSSIGYEVLRGKWSLCEKINPATGGGRVGSALADFDFLLNNLCQSVLSL